MLYMIKSVLKAAKKFICDIDRIHNISLSFLFFFSLQFSFFFPFLDMSHCSLYDVILFSMAQSVDLRYK
jgi:hypothetical protein